MRDADLRGFLAIYGGPQGAWYAPMVAVSLLGGGWSTMGLVPMLWHARTRHFAETLTLAIVTQALLVWFIKLGVGRVRPWIALGLAPPPGSPHDGSFPSGHAAGSFCVAVFVAIALPGAWPSSPRVSRSVGAVAVVVAALVALSRVYLGAHFPSDAAAGAALGTLVGAAAAAMYVPRGRPAQGVRRLGDAKREDAVECGAKRG